MNSRSAPHPPGIWAASEALQNHATLGAMLASSRRAEQCMAVARPLLGLGLSGALRPGPFENTTWVMLAAHGQAASKARHLLPKIVEALQSNGLGVSEVKVRVSPTRGNPN